MSVHLPPGANAVLPEAALRVELTWTHAAAADADLSGLLCAGRRVRSDADFVFSHQPGDPSGALRHVGKTGGGTPGSAVTDVLDVDLAAVEAGVDLIVVAAGLDAAPGTGFGVLSAAGLALTVRAAADGSALVVVPLTGLTTQRALVVAEVYRRGSGWKVRAVAQGYDDGLAGLARDFGVDVADEVPGPPPPAASTGPAWDWRDPPVPAGYGR